MCFIEENSGKMRGAPSSKAKTLEQHTCSYIVQLLS